MATVIERPEAVSTGSQHGDSKQLDGFLAELAELSRRFGLSISDGAFLYVMEPEDYARSYSADDESALSFT
jgi:hypothetical protein